MSEYIITDEQAKEIVNQLPAYYVPTWLYLWVHTEYPYEPPNDWIQVREKHIGVNLPEIVRCRDCKHATISTTGVCKYCEMFVLPDTDGYGADAQVNLPLDFFCAWGERRTDE